MIRFRCGKTEVGHFVGVVYTRFHWTHNLRVYVGLWPWKWRLWRPTVQLLPYSLKKSRELRRLPDPFPGRDDYLKERA